MSERYKRSGKIFKKILKEHIKKNDIIYWKGHVALALSNKKLIHAYGPMKKTVIMDIDKTIERIERTAKLGVKKFQGYNSKGSFSLPLPLDNIYLILKKKNKTLFS